MIDEIKRKQIYKILLMPIKCEKHCGFDNDRKIVISKDGGCVQSTETYWPQYQDKYTGEQFRYQFVPDCDMSDFACGFYEILYKDILQKMIVDEKGNLADKEFAGDTMTSAGKLPELRNNYHCLANFWLLPMEIGRKSRSDLSKTSGRYNIQDFMDRFLLLLKYKFNEYKSNYSSYFKNIDTFECFVKTHYLDGSYVEGKDNVKQFSNNIDSSTSDKVFKLIERRAEKLSKSKYADELWNYFYSWELCKLPKNFTLNE